MNPITILLAEDHLIVREGLRTLLLAEADMEVVGEAEDGQEAVDFTSTLCPDVVLMDITMPVLNGFGATRQILDQKTKTKVLILSSHTDPAYARLAEEMGASGYLVKQSDTHALPAAIRDAHQGKPFIQPSKPVALESQ